MAWYQQQARDLPWRKNCLPYPVWISEIMLQQTQVKTVIPKFNMWLNMFPDLPSLASASEEQVMKAWEGLGYYRRVRFIHASARLICDTYAGEFPKKFDDILALSGIGRSTAGAIGSICYGTATAVLDGNVKRVLRRWYGLAEATDKQLWHWASEEITTQQHDAGQWNQAMMELGATVCLARNTQCEICPVQTHCRSAHHNQPATPKKRIQVKHLHWNVLLHRHPDKGIWLIKRPETGIWATLWCLPIVEVEPDASKVPHHIHPLTHRRLHLYLEQVTEQPKASGKWFNSLDHVALPTGIRHLLDKSL